jgi:hypothetical protein
MGGELRMAGWLCMCGLGDQRWEHRERQALEWPGMVQQPKEHKQQEEQQQQQQQQHSRSRSSISEALSKAAARATTGSS